MGDLFEVREWPGHGRAAVAARAIPAGAVVWAEAPWLVWQGHMDSVASFADCVRAYAALQPAAERERLRAHFAKPAADTVTAHVVADLAQQLQPEVAPHLPVEEVAELLGLVSINNHSFSDGTALFRTAALLSHACTPNVRYSSVDGKLVYTALRDIAAGELLTYCYLPLEWLLRPIRDRTMRLLLEYDFVCDCARCTGPDWARGFPCAACAAGPPPAAAAAAAAAEDVAPARARHTFPTEGAWRTALAAAPRASLDSVQLDGPAAWRCVTCGSTAPPAAEVLAREAHWRARWNVLDGPLDQATPRATEPAGPLPFDRAEFRAEIDRVQADLGAAHYLTATWHRLFAEGLVVSSPVAAWAEIGVAAAFCRDVLGDLPLSRALRGPYLVRLSDSLLGRDGGVPSAVTLPDVLAAWQYWSASLAGAQRTAVVALLQRLARAQGCAHCHARPPDTARGTPALLTCASCHAVAYCNRDCQKQHWRLHKPACVPRAPGAATN